MSDANVPAWIGVPEVSDFLTLFQRAGTHFESGRYGEAREDYLRAIGAEPNHVDVFRAILKVELLEEMAASPGWYGERRPPSARRPMTPFRPRITCRICFGCAATTGWFSPLSCFSIWR